MPEQQACYHLGTLGCRFFAKEMRKDGLQLRDAFLAPAQDVFGVLLHPAHALTTLGETVWLPVHSLSSALPVGLVSTHTLGWWPVMGLTPLSLSHSALFPDPNPNPLLVLIITLLDTRFGSSMSSFLKVPPLGILVVPFYF